MKEIVGRGEITVHSTVWLYSSERDIVDRPELALCHCVDRHKGISGRSGYSGKMHGRGNS